MCAMMFRAAFARRLPFATSGSSCVSRMRTSASSAATKKPLSRTSTMTARIFSPSSMSALTFMSQTYLAKNNLENILQRHQSNFTPVAAQHDGEPLAAALHSAQRNFKPQILVQIQRRAHVIRQRLFQVQIRLEQQNIHDDKARDAAATVARLQIGRAHV